VSGKPRTKSDSGTSGYTIGRMWRCDSKYATPVLQVEAPKPALMYQYEISASFWRTANDITAVLLESDKGS
jgi:hypothetical protein